MHQLCIPAEREFATSGSGTSARSSVCAARWRSTHQSKRTRVLASKTSRACDWGVLAMLLAPSGQASVRMCGARVTPALASVRPRAVRAKHRLLARCAQDGAGGTQLAAAQQLDAAAATMARLRADLPFVVSRELLAEQVKYSFLAPLVTLTDRGDYVRVMSHWRQAVPSKLGSGWKVRHPQQAETSPAATPAAVP